MRAPRQTAGNLYQYDPLDRLISAHSIQRFYNSTRIATEIQGDRKTCFFEHKVMPLAELQPGDGITLLATDLQKTVLHSISHALLYQQIYSPYGHRHPTQNGLASLLGFNGERSDSVTGHYLLGQGHRGYNPVLMRFNGPDSLSPFGKGGLNAYAYCENDPINNDDPSGKVKRFFINLKLYEKPEALAAVRRATKSPGSIKKTKLTPKRAPKKTALPNPPNTQKRKVPATNISPSEGVNSLKKPSAFAHKTMDARKASTIQSSTAIDPIYNFSNPGEWRVRLALRPIRNSALPDEWRVRIIPNSMQPFVRLIRMEA